MNENKMTKEELAEKLNGIEYYFGIPKEFYPAMVENGLAVALVGIDDLCCFLFPKNGKVKTKVFDCSCAGEIFWFDRKLKKILYTVDQINREWNAVDHSNSIEAVWCGDIQAPDGSHYRWVYKTEIPHATFDTVGYDGDKISYRCRAIIFSINDLK